MIAPHLSTVFRKYPFEHRSLVLVITGQSIEHGPREGEVSTNESAIRLVLASASPRRRELLSELGASYQAVATDAEERDDETPAAVRAALPPLDLPLNNHPTLLAWRKAHAVASIESRAVILGADTIVVLDRDVLNKPRDAAHAREMLARLSNRAHTVYTGLCVLRPRKANESRKPKAEGAEHSPHSSFALRPSSQGEAGVELDTMSCIVDQFEVWLDLVASTVEVAPLSETEIAAYVATGEPLDKAGAYGIQGLGGRLVRAVYGSYTAVVGLPLPATYRLLRAAQISGLDAPDAAYQRWLQRQGKEPLPWPPTLP